MEEFFHLEIIFYFDKVEESSIVYVARQRGNPDYSQCLNSFCRMAK